MPFFGGHCLFVPMATTFVAHSETSTLNTPNRGNPHVEPLRQRCGTTYFKGLHAFRCRMPPLPDLTTRRPPKTFSDRSCPRFTRLRFHRRYVFCKRYGIARSCWRRLRGAGVGATLQHLNRCAYQGAALIHTLLRRPRTSACT